MLRTGGHGVIALRNDESPGEAIAGSRLTLPHANP